MPAVLTDFPPTRAAALERLEAFAPRAGRAYAEGRNTDPGPGRPTAVSRLSPYLRRRMITEREVVQAVLAHHDARAADKYLQEVLWRTYWKGWLEQRPCVWTRFLSERRRQMEGVDTRALRHAECGLTGIEGFDDWARELVETGYLHNHARMWFASIWIFTLRLPWALGADFFLRHLIDADPASNTLSWRWVAGLQTPGKTYLATRDNIARHTEGRFAPQGLAREAIAVTEPPLAAPRALGEPPCPPTNDPSLLLVTEEDLHPDSLMVEAPPISSLLVVADPDLAWGDKARRFTRAAASDACVRIGAHFGRPAAIADRLDRETLAAAARSSGVRRIETAYAPIGPVADRLASLIADLAAEDIVLVQRRRDWDSRFWPHATRGFFGFKAEIPAVLAASGRT
jgi:deoxyribodipyrimidine photo-lyase